MARWQLYTGLRISELLRLGTSDIGDVAPRSAPATPYRAIEVIRKGRKPAMWSRRPACSTRPTAT